MHLVTRFISTSIYMCADNIRLLLDGNLAMAIPFRDQFFVERRWNNQYSWGMFGGLIAIFLLYGIFIHWIPRLSRKYRTRHPRAYRVYARVLQFWNLFNATFRLRVWYLGTFYIQTTVFLVLALYILWLAMMSWCGTAPINYEPQSYIVGKKVGKVAISNMPLLLLFITKNDVMTILTGWPAHHLTLLHIWMGRVLYLMIVVHVVLCTKYWIDLNFKIMIIIPPQIIGMIAFGSMTMLTLLSPGFIRRLSYEFFLFNHAFFGGLMLLAGFLHNDGGKAGILLAVHALALDRIVLQVRALINHWCMKPSEYMATFTVLDAQTIKIVLPISDKDVKLFGRTLHTFGNWAPGQHMYIKVPSVGRFEWHPYTIASLSSTREMLIIMKVYKGFTKRLLKAVTKKCEEAGKDSCEIKTWFHGSYGSTLAPLVDFDSVVFVSGGTGASFTFPVALDLLQRMISTESHCRCQRVKFVWYTRSRESLRWYDQSIAAIREIIDVAPVGMISLEIYITSPSRGETTTTDIEILAMENTETEVEKINKKPTLSLGNVSTYDSLLNVETGRPNVYDLIELEIAEQRHVFGEYEHKDIAFLACGPAALVHEVAFEAERQERRNRNLSVYRYMEKYLV